MKLSRVFEGALAVVCVVVVGRSVYAAEATENSCRTFAAETYALRSLNHLNRMADTNGVPYFHILWDVSAEARHAGGIDGPDVISRMWQATVMARHLTGQTCRNEAVYAHVLQDTYLDSETGQPVKETGFLGFAQCVALEALVTAYADSRDPCLRETIIRMVDHMPEAYHPRSFQAVPIKALMNCARVLRPTRLENWFVNVDSCRWARNILVDTCMATYGRCRALLTTRFTLATEHCSITSTPFIAMYGPILGPASVSCLKWLFSTMTVWGVRPAR